MAFRPLLYLERHPPELVAVKVNERCENHRSVHDTRVGGMRFQNEVTCLRATTDTACARLCDRRAESFLDKNTYSKTSSDACYVTVELWHQRVVLAIVGIRSMPKNLKSILISSEMRFRREANQPGDTIRANGTSQKWTRPGIQPDPGGITRECPLLEGGIRPNVVSRVRNGTLRSRSSRRAECGSMTLALSAPAHEKRSQPLHTRNLCFGVWMFPVSKQVYVSGFGYFP